MPAASPPLLSLSGRTFAFLLCCVLLVNMGCAASSPSEGFLAVAVKADQTEKAFTVPGGSTVQYALEQAGVTLSPLDRVTPPVYTLVENGQTIQVTRIQETFEVEETTIPFERQTVRNESLPEGQTLLIQPGVNGTQQITYRLVSEDGVQTSRAVFKSLTLSESRPEIIMVGVQTPFIPVSIPGTLTYLTAGNAWVISNSSGERKPVVTTGDLDGRVFALSPDSAWLLFTRVGPEDDQAINSLWVVDITAANPEPIDLGVENVIHYAGWVPRAGLVVAYSTVEPRDTAPGWQANNDLHFLTLGSIGGVVRDDEVVPPNSGGIYGWWGTDFLFSPDGDQLAYSRPDGMGLVNLEDGQLQTMLTIPPLQTRSDWAWVPGFDWSPDGQWLIITNHVPLPGLSSDEASPLFDLAVLSLGASEWLDLVPQTGMFAYPVYSPRRADDRYHVAYLQAIFPEQSETSRYRVMLMDRDGSNRTAIFPPDGSAGIEPQQVVWGPQNDLLADEWLGVIYQGNLWLLNLSTGRNHQITGDGSIIKLDWK